MKSINNRMQKLLLPTLVGALIVLMMKAFVLINVQSTQSLVEQNSVSESIYTQH